jgi:YesN/AraC family two-component response regulator
MVSLRCKNLVKAKLEYLGIDYLHVDLGFVDLVADVTKDTLTNLNRELKLAGLEILDDHNAIIIEKVKNCISQLVHDGDAASNYNLSLVLSEKLMLDYGYLTNLFTKVKGQTIQQFYISHKIEKAKELILYNEMSLSQIAELLHYSSIAHFSNQFKKITGLAPSVFKKLKVERTTNIEDL